MGPRSRVALVLFAGCAPARGGEPPPFRVPPPDPPTSVSAAAQAEPPRSIDAGEIVLRDADTPTPDADLRGQLLTLAQAARGCFPSQPTRVSFSMIVGVGGSVVEAHVYGGDPRTAGCVQNALVGWRFPEASGSRVVATIAYVPTSSSADDGTAPFDRGAAAAALGGVNVGSCAQPGGPSGAGRISVTFATDGAVRRVVCTDPPFAGTAVGACIEQLFRRARVPAFSGAEVTVGKAFRVP